MRIRKLAVFAAAMALSGLVFAADEYKIDPVHSTVGFSVKHFGISTVPGKFTDFSGIISYDEQDVTKSFVKVAIKSASIDTGNGGRDKDLRSPNFFDVAKYPDITFESTQIKKSGEGWVAVGTLVMHGVTKTIELPFTVNGKANDPWGNERIGAEARIKIRRQDYGISADPGLIGDEVKIELLVEAARPLPKK